MLGAFVLMKHREETPVPLTRSFSTFPLSVSNWEGTPLSLSQEEKDILKADDYALVNYSPVGGGTSVLFYTAYYRHQTAARNIHSPKNCLPSSGWAILHSQVIDVALKGVGGKKVKVNEAVIQKGLETQVVLYWYQERGRIFDNEYWGRFYLVKDALTMHRTDGALIRLSMPMTGTVQKTVESEVHLLQSLSPLLAQYIPGRTLSTDRRNSGSKDSSDASAHGIY
jgi:EpsI family protein